MSAILTSSQGLLTKENPGSTYLLRAGNIKKVGLPASKLNNQCMECLLSKNDPLMKLSEWTME